VIVKDLLDPDVTLTLPDGEMEPPVPAEEVMVYVFAVKVAVAVKLFVIVPEHVVLVLPVHTPDHPVKVEFASGVAVRVT
jgi:hypothetical protein